jgi:hypothetical protein
MKDKHLAVINEHLIRTQVGLNHGHLIIKQEKNRIKWSRVKLNIYTTVSLLYHHFGQ